MFPTLYTEFIVALGWIFVWNVFSQSTGCGYVNTDLQNVNEKGAWPWMVAITKKEKEGNYIIWCNGFLIDRRHALTAANCFDSNYDVTDFLIHIGEMNWNEGEAYEVSSIIKHPRYERGQAYDDIAMLTLSINVDTPNYAPICLADANLILDGVEVTKTAWGAVEAGDSISGTMIENVGLRIISNRDCSRTFRKLMGNSFTRQFPSGLSSGMVCTENRTGQMESCGGSSGAPLMYRDFNNNWFAVGISVFGYSCGTGAPSGFTRVSAYLDWVIENTREDKDCGYVNRDLQNTNEEGAWPWMVAITKEIDGIYLYSCNGFLIDRRHVLTAAHCFDEKDDVSDFLLRIGKSNWEEGETYTVTCIKRHHRFDWEQLYDDIAILTLSRNVDTRNYAPICIPDENLRIKNMTGVEVTKAAWGINLIHLMSRTLLQSSGLRIISNRDCQKMVEKLVGWSYTRHFVGGVSGDMMCTENHPTTQTENCEYDSGAPLMYRDKSNKWIAVGIASYGVRFSCEVALTTPSGFTRVAAYLEWIAGNTIDDKGNCSYAMI